jgi:hypothetical protein
MEEVPDADLVAEGPPAEPAPRPLGPGWQSVGRGLGLVQLGLLVFFGGWGLVVMATFALLVFSLADAERAGDLLVHLSLLGNLLGVVVCTLLVAGRLRCCAFDEKPSSGSSLARLSVAATLLGALSWLVLLVLSAPVWSFALPPAALVVGWLVGLTFTGLGEVTFLLFLREAGRCLPDPIIGDRVRRLFTGLGLFTGLVLVAALLSLLLLASLGQTGVWFRLALLAAVILVGIAGVALVVRYLAAVSAARQAIGGRLAPSAVTATG